METELNPVVKFWEHLDYVTLCELDGEKFAIIGESWEKIEALVKECGAEDFEEILELVNGGREWGYSDEYTCCDDCGGGIHLYPNYYGDTGKFWRGEGFILCRKCVLEDTGSYLASLVNNPKTANQFLTVKQLEENGFKLVGENYESGWHPGQNDSPEKIYQTLVESGSWKEIIFNLDSSGQFDLTFSVFAK